MEQETQALDTHYKDKYALEKERHVERVQQALKQRYQKELDDAMDKLRTEYRKKHEERVATLTSLSKELKSHEELFKQKAELERKTKQLLKIQRAYINLYRTATEKSQPFAHELKSLERTSTEDPLIRSAIGAIPKDVAEQGIPTIEQLKKSFEQVSKVGRQSIVAAEEDKSLLQKMKGLYNASAAAVPDLGGDAFSRASWYMENGNLEKAVHELNQIEKNKDSAVVHWIEDAKKRLVVETSLNIIDSEISVLTAELVQQPAK